jgi:alpha-D-ribose 1-methylphosphonate 5-triphosphate diphosphatase
MNEFVITNAQIVTRHSIVHGDLVARDGIIVEITPRSNSGAAAPALDLGGDFLLPGLVELHTDNLECAVTPRPGVNWPAASAVVTHDAEMAVCGITTVYDAIAVGDIRRGSERLDKLCAMVEAISTLQAARVLRADHRLHLRCELSYPELQELLAELIDHALVGLVSLMDHTPGQRQFVTLDQYKTYYQGKYGLSDTALEMFVADRRRDQARYAVANRSAVIAMTRERGIRVASHDDATAEHIDEAVAAGAAIAEFPTTLDAAAAARRAGLSILGGAPNIVRGSSHSGNASALDFARAGLLDILSSDYVPVALLHAAFKLGDDMQISLPDAVATVSANPAAAAGLPDRGMIAEGLRADLVRVRNVNGIPVACATWRGGERIA